MASCSWDSGSSRVDQHAPLQYVRQLEERIRILEHNKRTHEDDMQTHHSPQVPIRKDASPPEQTGSYGAQWLTHDKQSSTGVPATPEQKNPTETPLIPAVIGTATNQSRKQESYGSSSAGSFIQHVCKVVEQKVASPPTTSMPMMSNQADLPLMAPKDDGIRVQVEWALPTRKKADELMNVYWNYIHTIYPWLDRRMTTLDFESLWKADKSIPHQRSFLCLLNLMFAMSSQLAEFIEPQDRAATANMFYVRAKSFLDNDNIASVRHVQIYLSFGLYLQSTNEPHQCWMFIGLAIRTAQSLELHKPETNERPSNARISALLHRVWYGCVLMDRMLAMTYGQPCMLTRGAAMNVPPCVPVDGEEIYVETDTSRTSMTKMPAMVDFFNCLSTLYNIVYDILVNLYSSEPPQFQTLDDVYQRFFEGYHCSSHELNVLEIDRKLATWKRTIPIHLQIGSYPERGGSITVLSRQATILHQR